MFSISKNDFLVKFVDKITQKAKMRFFRYPTTFKSCFFERINY